MDSEKYFSPLTRLIDYYTKSLYKDEDGSTHLSIECHSLLLHIAGIRNKNKLELFLIDMMPKEKKLFYFGG